MARKPKTLSPNKLNIDQCLGFLDQLIDDTPITPKIQRLYVLVKDRMRNLCSDESKPVKRAPKKKPTANRATRRRAAKRKK